MLKRYLANIKKEFLLMSRDIHTLLVLFVMPVVFILLMSLAMQDAFSEQKSVTFNTIVYSDGQDDLAKALIKSLQNSQNFELITTDDADIKKQMEKNDILLGISIENKSTESEPKITLFLSPEESERMNRRVSPTYGRNSPPRAAVSRLRTQEQYIGYHDEERKKPSSVQQSVPAWLIFSMFFIIIPISNTFINEKRQETLSRLAVMNISVGELLLSKLIPYFIINTIQMILMVLIGIYLVPLLGGEKLVVHLKDWPLLLLVSSFVSFAAISFALAISSFVKTTEQAVSLGGLLNITFAALGGVMVPVFVMPHFMQYVTNLSPMAWSLEGFLAIFLYNGDLSKTIMPIISLALFGGISLIIARYKLKREITEG
ncbi:MAG: ABC transporter permease [Sulfurovaceae bacterium]